MAWRIHEYVVRGEIDNRVRNRITGLIWFVGRDEPVKLELTGNAWRNLAGRRIEFVNRAPKPGLAPEFVSHQLGVTGDFTASRRVKVLDVSTAEAMRMADAGEKFPFHWANSVYFEWFSALNGRVVIESADYQLTISTDDPSWEMTEAEEKDQQRANAAAIEEFMAQIAGAAGTTSAEMIDEDSDEDGEDEDEGSDGPLSEEAADKLMAEAERLTDALQARIEAAGDSADLETILDEELRRWRRRNGADDSSADDAIVRSTWEGVIEDASEEEAADETDLNEELDRRHPLAERARALSLRVMKERDERKWVPEGASPEHPVADLIASILKAGGKMAGALDGRGWPPAVAECALSIAWLKRARGYFDDALEAAATCEQDGLAEAAWLYDVKVEVVGLAAEIDALIDELRARLERGWE